MASPYLPTEQAIAQSSPEILGIERQRKLADLLTAQAFQQPQGQMISGHYVAPSWTQQLAPLANALAGEAISNRVDKKQQELAEALRGKQKEAVDAFTTAKTPKEKFVAATSEYAPAWLKSIGAEMLKAQKAGEGDVISQLDLETGAYNPILKGAPKYHAPTSVDMGTMGTKLIYSDGRTEIIPKGVQGPAGQVLETDSGPMLINTRTGAAQPIMLNGQPVVGGKPLTESQSNATAFGMRAKEANAIITDLENKGVTNTGLTRATIAGGVGGTPFIGERLENTANTLLNWTASAEQQKTKQARQNFITAVLRKESGATIKPEEFKVEEEKYFPTINDSPEVIKQKQKARELAIKALEVQAGPGKRQIEQLDTPATGGWSVKSVK